MNWSQTGIKPFRALAIILTLIVLVQIYGIITTPTYEKELAEARLKYMELQEIKYESYYRWPRYRKNTPTYANC